MARGRRIRIRDLKAQAAGFLQDAEQTLAKAQSTLNIADRSLLELTAAAMRVLLLAADVLEEVQDGITIEAEVLGKAIPIKAKIHLLEEVDDEPS